MAGTAPFCERSDTATGRQAADRLSLYEGSINTGSR